MHPVLISEEGLSALLSFGWKSRVTDRIWIFRKLGPRDTAKLADQSEHIRRVKMVP